jgi:hypothetical protein
MFGYINYNFTPAANTNIIGTRNFIYGGEWNTAAGSCNLVYCDRTGTFGHCNTVCHSCSSVLGVGITTKAACHAHVNALWIQTAPTYADNAAAITAGLTGGQVYKTSTGTLQIVY